MSLSPGGIKRWNKILRKEGLNKVRINLSQDKYNKGRYIKDYIAVWIKIEEEKILLAPSRKANIIAIVTTILFSLSLIGNIIQYYTP